MSGGPRPLYARALRLRHLHLRSLGALLLFEGSVAFAILLILADLVPVWAVVVIPVAVAVMVKLNDLVAGALNRPLAIAQLRTPRPADRVAVGRSSVPYGGASTRMNGRATVGADGPVPTGRPHAGGVPAGSDESTGPGDGEGGLDRTDGREPRTWAIAKVVARGRASVRSSKSSGADRSSGAPSGVDRSSGSSRPSGSAGPDAMRPDGADRHNRGNTGRFAG